MGRDLSSSDGVLGCAAGEVVDFVVLDQIFVEGHVFFFCEDCIVGFDIVSVISGQLKDGILFKDVCSTADIRKVALKGRYVTAWISRRGLPNPKRTYSCDILILCEKLFKGVC